MKKRKKAESGIGVFGVFFAILLFFIIRGCVNDNHQDNINEFCVENGYSFGEESIRNTLIICQDYNYTTPLQINYNDYEYWINQNKTKLKRDK